MRSFFSTVLLVFFCAIGLADQLLAQDYYLELTASTSAQSSSTASSTSAQSSSTAWVQPGGSFWLKAVCYDSQSGAKILTTINVGDGGGNFGSGGHNHNTTRPKGTLNPTSGFPVLFSFYTAPAAGGNHTIWASTENCGSAELPVEVSVEPGGSPEMGPNPNYALIGWKAEHPNNHHGTSSFISRVTTIATQYRNEFPSLDVLGINDVSLKFGGIFDLNFNWQPPHDTHRDGTRVDIRANGQPNSIPFDQDVRTRFKVIALNNGVNCDVHDAGTTKEHYHCREL